MLIAGCSALDPAEPEAGAGDVIARVEPLGEPLEVAFKAGYHADEQLWLRGASGALRRIETWKADPRWEPTCCCSFSTGGYREGAGRFGPLVIDHSGRYLLVAEQLACEPETGAFPTRILAHEISTGVTRVLAETRVMPSITVSPHGTFVSVDRRSGDHPAALELFELREDALRSMDLPEGGEPLAFSEEVAVLRWKDARYVILPHAAALEDRGQGFEPTTLFDGFAGPMVTAIGESPSGERLCLGTRELSGPDEGRTRVAVLQPDGRWLTAELGTHFVGRCVFSADERHLATTSQVLRLTDDELVVNNDVPTVVGTWRDRLFAIRGEGDPAQSLVEIGWESLVTPLVGLSELPALCGSRDPASFHLALSLPPDDRPLALLALSCGCTDCDISGSVALRLDDLGLETIEVADGEHDVHDTVFVPSGGALVFSAQRAPGEDESDVQPEAGAFFAIDPDGNVTTEGPLPSVKGVLHGGAVMPAWIDAKRSSSGPPRRLP